MKHYAYAMRSEDKDPSGMGDTSSWFFFYKWTEGEVFVPDKGRKLEGIQPGDCLWLFMDELLRGCVEVLRVEDGPQGELEVWYDASARRKAPRMTVLNEKGAETHIGLSMLPSETAEITTPFLVRWLQQYMCWQGWVIEG